MPLAALVLLLLAAWAATGLSVRWNPGPAAENGEETGASPDQTRKRAIEEARADQPSTIDYRALDQRFQRIAEEQSVVGLAVGIVENGKIRFLKGYGETVAGSGDPVTTDTIFRWASVSKGVAADMVAKLAEDEKLALYEPVSKYASSLRLPAGNEHKATISDLLSHQLGIFGHADDSRLESGFDARLLRSDLARLNTICPVNSCHAYQNVAYDAASEIVEKVTGKPYEQVVLERMFRPLGMTSASVSRDGLLNAPSWARPHRGGKNSNPVEVTDSYYRVPAAGGVNSSIKDLARWMQGQMGLEPQVLSKSVLEAVQTPRVETPREQRRMREFSERLSNARYGLGWRIYDYAGHRVIGHRGGVTGYRSLILFDPEKKSGVVAFWNASTSRPSGLEFEVMDMIYQLPHKDWLDLDGQMKADEQPAEEEAVTDSGP